MATNNAINIKSSGIVSYDGAGTFTALADPLIVSNGGTGVASFTAYTVLCGGTTSTAALQNVSAVGTTGQALTSNGAGALPTFQNITRSGYILTLSVLSGNPVDGATYFLANGTVLTTITTSRASSWIYIPVSGNITIVYGSYSTTVSGSAQNVTLDIRLNGTTATNITTTLQMTAASGTFNNTGLSIAVSQGDYIEVRMISPTWSPTNPSGVRLSVSILVSG